MSDANLFIEQSLSVDQIRSWIETRCKSEAGAAWVRKANFSKNFGALTSRLGQTREMIKILSSGEIPNRHFYDLKEFLVKIKVEGTFLEGEEYLTIANSIRAIDEWMRFFGHQEYPLLESLGDRLEVNVDPVHLIERSINENGEVKDTASPELSAIRKRIGDAERSARSALSRILKKSISEEFSGDESQVTLRDGRLVIPVKAEFKRNIPGLIHDESATGQTVFLEPSEALALNNEVRELNNRERREVIRILISIADEIRLQYDDLIRGSDWLALLDFIHAKAVWARDFNAIAPEIHKYPDTQIFNGFHPILWHSHDAVGKSVIPLNLALNRDQRMLVVSGPNAGGKSVVLKTVGLLQYMVQCGFPVPVAEQSKFGMFDEILLDIGDTQSIEDDLSTYSAHLRAMKSFLIKSGKRTLVLIDEFGKGTEPQFGGAMAESILKELNESGCYGVITTHYQNLKDLADASKGMVNGAMKFDIGQLNPLFQLEIGKPGSSFAFEIAGKIGLPKKVIEYAKGTMQSGQVDFDQSLSQLEREKQKYQKLAAKLDKDKKQAVEVKKEYEELREMMQEEKKQIIREAKQEAKRLLASANKDIERTIREIKESKADKEKTRIARENLTNKSAQIKIDKAKPTTRVKGLSVGDQVKMSGHDGVGIILKMKEKEAEVQFGLLKSFVKFDRLVKVSGPRREEKSKRSVGYNRFESVMDFKHELTIRGMRAEEALPSVDSFVDKAIMIGVNEARIIHGKGHGILRDLVRNHLSDHPNIMKVEDDHADRGGSGISILTFK